MSLALHAPDQTLAAGLRDGAAILFSLKDSTVIRRLSLGRLAITAMAFTDSVIISQFADDTMARHTSSLQHRLPVDFKSACKTWTVSPFGVLYTQLVDPGPIVSVDVLTGRQLSRSIESYTSPRLSFIDRADFCGLVVASRESIATYSLRL